MNIAQRERKIAATERELTTRLGRDPTDEEIAEAAGLTAEQVREMADASRVVTSLDRPVGEEGETAFGDLLPSEGLAPEEEVHIANEQQLVLSVVEDLPEPERDVIKLRFGLNGDREPQPMSQVGRKLGIPPEKVGEIERRALEHLAMRREVRAMRDAA